MLGKSFKRLATEVNMVEYIVVVFYFAVFFDILLLLLSSYFPLQQNRNN